MLSGLIWLSRKIYTTLNTSLPHNNESIPPFLFSLEEKQTKGSLNNFLNVGTFININKNTFFVGRFHGPPGTSIYTAKWILLEGTDPVRMKTLFRFWGDILESYFFPFEKSIQVIEYHGTSVIIHEKKNNTFYVSLYKVKNQQLKRIRTIYVAKDLSEVTVPCLRSLFIKKNDKIVIGGLHKWVIYDLKAQYFVYQHHLLHDMICDLVYSESLNILFVCYLKSVVAYEWKIPFEINKIAFTIELDRDENPTIYLNLYLSENLLVLKDFSKISVWRVTKHDYNLVSEINVTSLCPSFNLDSDEMIIPEKECTLIRDPQGKIYEIGFDEPQYIKCQAEGFNALLAYNKEKEQLALVASHKFLLLEKAGL